MGLFNTCLVFAAFYLCVSAQRRIEESTLSSYQHLCSAGEIIEGPPENGRRVFYATPNCVQKVSKLLESQPNSPPRRGPQPDGGQPQPQGTKTYEVFTEETDFYQAQRNCAASGKTLAEVNSMEEQAALESIIINQGSWDSMFWIGGHYVDNTLKWIGSNQNIMYAKWARGSSPANRPLPREGCVMANEKNVEYRWSIVDCTEYAKYICQFYQQEPTAERRLRSLW